MDYNGHEPCSPSSLKQKLRSSLCIIPCFARTSSHHHRGHHHSVTAPPSPNIAPNVSLVRTSSLSSSKSRSSHHHHHHHGHNNHYEFAELKDKCKHLIGRMGRGHRRRNSSSPSADFKYDALSYALNFDHEEDNSEDYHFRSFSDRLPHSPPRTSQAEAASPSASKEITACS